LYLFVTSGGSFSILDWHQMPIGLTAQTWLFLAFLVAFAVKVPMWPVHTWLPDAHVEAPTGGSIVLAAIALKLGAYGFLRFSLPIAPDASHELAGLVIALSLIAIIYIGFVALVQDRHEETGRLFVDRPHGLRDPGLLHLQRHGRRRRPGPDDFARLRLGRDVLLHRRHVRPGAFATDCRLWRGGQHHAQVCCLLHAVRHGQRRPAGDLRLRRRVHGHPRRRRPTSGSPLLPHRR
jgi:hypothetical protein